MQQPPPPLTIGGAQRPISSQPRPTGPPTFQPMPPAGMSFQHPIPPNITRAPSIRPSIVGQSAIKPSQFMPPILNADFPRGPSLLHPRFPSTGFQRMLPTPGNFRSTTSPSLNGPSATSYEAHSPIPERQCMPEVNNSSEQHQQMNRNYEQFAPTLAVNGHTKPEVPTSFPEPLMDHSSQSSANPSPIPTPKLDRMERQGTPYMGLTPVGSMTSLSDSSHSLNSESVLSVGYSEAKNKIPRDDDQGMMNGDETLHVNGSNSTSNLGMLSQTSGSQNETIALLDADQSLAESMNSLVVLSQGVNPTSDSAPQYMPSVSQASSLNQGSESDALQFLSGFSNLTTVPSALSTPVLGENAAADGDGQANLDLFSCGQLAGQSASDSQISAPKQPQPAQFVSQPGSQSQIVPPLSNPQLASPETQPKISVLSTRQPQLGPGVSPIAFTHTAGQSNLPKPITQTSYLSPEKQPLIATSVSQSGFSPQINSQSQVAPVNLPQFAAPLKPNQPHFAPVVSSQLPIVAPINQSQFSAVNQTQFVPIVSQPKFFQNVYQLQYSPQTSQTQFAPQTIQPQFAPQTSQPQFVPQTSQPQFTPQTSQPQFAPQTSQPQYAPQTTQPQFAPQTTQPQFAPQTTQPQFAPQITQPQFAPQTTQLQFAPQTSQPQFAPQTSQPQFAPQTSQPQFAPQISQTQFVSKVSQPQFTAQYSQSRFPPPVGQPQFPTSVYQPQFPTKVGQPPFVPPVSQTQFAPPVSQQQIFQHRPFSQVKGSQPQLTQGTNEPRFNTQFDNQALFQAPVSQQQFSPLNGQQMYAAPYSEGKTQSNVALIGPKPIVATAAYPVAQIPPYTGPSSMPQPMVNGPIVPQGPMRPPADTSALSSQSQSKYPQSIAVGGIPAPQYAPATSAQLSSQLGGLSVTRDGWNRAWGTQQIDLLQQRVVVPPTGVVAPRPILAQEYLPNCSQDIFRCTLTRIPESKSVLTKARLPFGILIHPFKDLEHLPVVSCNTIVRCRACRTYINPFVVFKGERRWECNLCYRTNELPEEFQYDPVSRTYGDPSRRPEVREATIEFIAPQEYMLRPPQPATYLWVLDVSRQAVDTGYLKVLCDTLLDNLDKIPGDRRTTIGFITFASSVQVYLMAEGQKRVQMLDLCDTEDVFVPSPEDLLVNLDENRPVVEDLLGSLADAHSNNLDDKSALGAALQLAYKLMGSIGGRVTLVTTTLPNTGPGALESREDPNQRSSKDIPHLGPANDFYKKLALDCSGQQISVDLFTLNSQYIDLATLSGVSKFSGGSMFHFPGFNYRNGSTVGPFVNCLTRYITRKIGFEAVMRIRATRGLTITNFHGNFFVRSTDLLSLPTVNPDSAFGMQVNIEEPLHNIRQACFQAALLYTSSRGERRIRVHSLCVPVTPNIHEVIISADQQAVISLLAKMAADRCVASSMSDARDALLNACVDAMASYRAGLSSPSVGGLNAPLNLTLLPLYTLALFKTVSFRSGLSTKLDDRVFAMCELKSLPLRQLILNIYPDLYPIHDISEVNGLNMDDDMVIPQPSRLHLSAERLDRTGAYLMDAGDTIYIYMRAGISPQWVDAVFGMPSYAAIPQPLYDNPLPPLETKLSELVRAFVAHLQRLRPYNVPVIVLKEDNPARMFFIQRLVDDRTEGAHSYVEFLQYIKSQVK